MLVSCTNSKCLRIFIFLFIILDRHIKYNILSTYVLYIYRKLYKTHCKLNF